MKVAEDKQWKKLCFSSLLFGEKGNEEVRELGDEQDAEAVEGCREDRKWTSSIM